MNPPEVPTRDDSVDHTVSTVEQLRSIVGHPSDRVATKVRDRLTDVHRAWIARSPFVVISTTGGGGAVDASPKGDPPGFVRVIDDTTIAIPERPGNKRVDGYLNVLADPHVGTLFLVPGRGDTLRINGTARIVSDADYFDDMIVAGKRPILALEVSIEETFFHCAKAFMRSHLWDTDTWAPEALPTVAQICHAVMDSPGLPELEQYYAEDNYRRTLY